MKNIYRYLEIELKEFDRIFYKTLKSDVKFIDTIVKYFFKMRGKMVRPLMVLLSSKMFGNPNESTYKAAVTMELLHSATLMHDDVVDKAEFRRNLPTLNAVWNNKTAVLFGDYLLSRSLRSMLSVKNFEVLDILSEVSETMARGELLQVVKAKKLNIDEDVYCDVIKGKTASLFRTSALLGAVTSDENSDVKEKMAEFGEKIGIAFQIKDDILDFTGKRTLLGKSTGNDLKEKKVTLPLIHVLKNIDEKEKKKILSKISKGVKSKDISDIISLVKEKGGIEFAENKIKELTDNAIDILMSISSKNEEARDMLIRLSQELTIRKK